MSENLRTKVEYLISVETASLCFVRRGGKFCHGTFGRLDWPHAKGKTGKYVVLVDFFCLYMRKIMLNLLLICICLLLDIISVQIWKSELALFSHHVSEDADICINSAATTVIHIKQSKP